MRSFDALMPDFFAMPKPSAERTRSRRLLLMNAPMLAEVEHNDPERPVRIFARVPQHRAPRELDHPVCAPRFG